MNIKSKIEHVHVTLDLSTGIYKPYCKPNNIPVYVNVKSNNHPSVIKAIPLGVNKRLNMISANEEARSPRQSRTQTQTCL